MHRKSNWSPLGVEIIINTRSHGQEKDKSAFNTNVSGESANAVPTTTNYAVEFPTFGEITGVSTTEVQWMSLTLGKPPS